MKNRIKKILPKQLKLLLEDGDIKYIFKNSRYNVYVQIANLLSGFFISWCFANFTTVEFYGTYLFITSVTSFFTFLSFSGINQSLTQSTSSGYDFFFKTAVKKSLIYTQLGTIALILYNFYYLFFFEYNPIIFMCILISAATFSFGVSSNLYRSFLFGKEEYRKEYITRMVTYSIRNSLLLILIFLISNLILYFFLLNILTLISNYIFYKKTLNLIETQERDPEKDDEALKFGLSLTKLGMISIISTNINNLIIGTFYGPKILAFYIIGKGLATKTLNFIKPSLSSLLTKYSKKNAKFSRKFLLSLIGSSFLLFFGLMLVLPFYLQIFFPKYIDSILYGIAYSFILLIYPLEVAINYYFRGKLEKNIIRNASLIPNVLSLLILVPLLLILGIFGLILTDFLRHLMRLLIFITYRKKIKLS